MRPAPAVAAAALIASALGAAAGRPAGAPPHPPFEIRGPAAAGFESPAGLVVFDARIDDRHAVRLLLDTGDPGGLTLDAGVARAIGLPLDDGTLLRAAGVAGAGAARVHRGRVASLRIGEIVAHGLAIAAVSGAPRFTLPDGGGVDGFLGLDLLRPYRVTLDYAARRMTMSPPGGGPARGSGAPPLRVEGGRAVVEVILNGTARRAMILDTAAMGTLLSSADEPLTRPAPGPGERVLADAGGRTVTAATRILASVALGGAVLRDVPVLSYDFGTLDPAVLAGAPPDIGGVVGADILSRLVIDLDVPGRSFRATRRPGT